MEIKLGKILITIILCICVITVIVILEHDFLLIKSEHNLVIGAVSAVEYNYGGNGRTVIEFQEGYNISVSGYANHIFCKDELIDIINHSDNLSESVRIPVFSSRHYLFFPCIVEYSDDFLRVNGAEYHLYMNRIWI